MTKLSSSGDGLLYSTHVWGGYDGALVSLWTPQENAYVTGETDSSDFPLVSPIQSVNAWRVGGFCDQPEARPRARWVTPP